MSSEELGGETAITISSSRPGTPTSIPLVESESENLALSIAMTVIAASLESSLQDELEVDNEQEDENPENPLLEGTTTGAGTSNDRENNDNSEIFILLQEIACLVAHSFALLGIFLAGWWIHLLGGLSSIDSKRVFNWHPLLMMVAFSFMTMAALSFRFPYYRHLPRPTIKLIHLIAWTVAAISATIALIAVFQSHNNGPKFISNLYSLHSWLGLGVIGLYVLQFLAGFFAFGGWITLSWITPSLKAQVLAFHKFLGPFLYMAVAATVLLGIQEKEGFINCSYAVEKADLFPMSHLFQIPTPCLVSHALGIVVFATACCTSFALHSPR